MAQEQVSEDQSAEVLETLRRYRSLTYEQLGQRAGMHFSSASDYARGRSQMTTAKLYQFAAALEVDPAVFLMSPEEALGWVLANRPNGTHRSRRNRTKPGSRKTCFSLADKDFGAESLKQPA